MQRLRNQNADRRHRRPHLSSRRPMRGPARRARADRRPLAAERGRKDPPPRGGRHDRGLRSRSIPGLWASGRGLIRFGRCPASSRGSPGFARPPEIVECDRVTGEDCFVARAHLRSIEDLERLIDQIIPHAMTTTSIIQSTLVKRRPPPIGWNIDETALSESQWGSIGRLRLLFQVAFLFWLRPRHPLAVLFSIASASWARWSRYDSATSRRSLRPISADICGLICNRTTDGVIDTPCAASGPSLRTLTRAPSDRQRRAATPAPSAGQRSR